MIRFDVPADVAFDYLADPLNRPEWQSSLARVEQVTGEPQVGQTWVDVTKAGLRPAMETTELDRPHRWSERGTWRGVSATLTLTFEPEGEGCVVSSTIRARAPGLLAPLGRALGVVAPYVVHSDLRRAALAVSRRA